MKRSIASNPVLIGAVTVLVVIVAVFLSYNANQGLPFVPTYDLKAEIPNGQKLIAGNEIRLGGFRVGVVNDMKPIVINVGYSMPDARAPWGTSTTVSWP